MGGPVLECAGAIDPDTVPVLRNAVQDALAARPAPPMLVIDLGAVTFCDSIGLNTLLRARTDAARQGTALHLTRPAHIVARMLEITGTDQVFTIDQDVPASRTAPPARPGGSPHGLVRPPPGLTGRACAAASRPAGRTGEPPAHR
ncbi:STAS domain-containing protein [Kitasatospora sp. NPDC057223]|uniref:STAS domain-containing protein n=1 Tax=Kitasatospora sp. NPDC057223 TaxID=3346055 RepID=UPI003635077D